MRKNLCVLVCASAIALSFSGCGKNEKPVRTTADVETDFLKGSLLEKAEYSFLQGSWTQEGDYKISVTGNEVSEEGNFKFGEEGDKELPPTTCRLIYKGKGKLSLASQETKDYFKGAGKPAPEFELTFMVKSIELVAPDNKSRPCVVALQRQRAAYSPSGLKRIALEKVDVDTLRNSWTDRNFSREKPEEAGKTEGPSEQ